MNSCCYFSVFYLNKWPCPPSCGSGQKWETLLTCFFSLPVTILFTCFVPCTFLVFLKLVHFFQFSWLLVELAFLFLLLSTQAILCITAKLLQNSWSTSLLTFLVIQWLGIFLPMQETRVQFLVWEDPICQGATKSTHYNYWSPCALEPMLGYKRSHCSEKPVHGNYSVSPARCNLRKPACNNKDPVRPKLKIIFFKLMIISPCHLYKIQNPDRILPSLAPL